MKIKKYVSVAMVGLLVASLYTSSFALDSNLEENKTPVTIFEDSSKDVVDIKETDGLASVRKIDEEDDLYSKEGMEAFLGDTLKVYSKKGSIKENSVVVYQKEDGSEVSFNASKDDSEDDGYYFAIKPDTRGMWKIVSIDGVKVESEEFNFMTYTDIRDFNEMNNKDNPLLDENFMIKPEIDLKPRVRRAPSNSRIPVSRYSGSTRYETAVNISRNNFTSADTAIVVYGKAPSDALASTGLAKVYNAPVLYTESTSLNSLVRNELQRLGVSKVFVIGGESSVNESVIEEIYDAGVSDVQRIAGARRADTALALANEMRKVNTGKAAVVVDGYSENDCLAVATSSGEYSNPMVYANNGSLDAQSKAFVKNNYRSVFIMSGEKKINQDVVNYFRNAGLKVYTKNESSSYNLSLSIAKDSMFYGTVRKIYVAANAPDGIPGSVLGAKDGQPLLLVNNSTENSIIEYAKNKNISSAVILGGVNSVSSSFADKISKVHSSETTIPGDVSVIRKRIIAEAEKHIGKRYKYGTEGPNTFDCSGLVMFVYKNVANINLPRQSKSQGNQGRAISRAELKPGDLIFWGNPITHVAIYKGNNRIIHAANENDGVLEQVIYGTPSRYRRIIND